MRRSLRGIFFKRALRTHAAYALVAPVVDLFNFRENPAYRIWSKFLLSVAGCSYGRRRPVIWTNSFFPTEIIYGLGAIPFLPEIVASVVTYLGWSQKPLARADSSISTDICSFYRCILGLALDGFLPEPDLIVTCSHLCDGANKLFNYMGLLYGCRHLLLDVPYGEDRYAIKYAEETVRHTVEEICTTLHIHLDTDKIVASVTLSNRAREYRLIISKLREAVPSPFPGSEALSYVAGMNFSSLGSNWGVRFFESLAKEIEKKVTLRRGYLREERHRLLWLHHVRPYYRNEIFEVLDRNGAAVAFEEASYVYWPPLDPANPWKSLAEKVVSNLWAGPLERRKKALEEMVERYSIDGVIHFAHWGCRQSCGGKNVIGDWLREKNIPYLVLQGDCVDPNNYSPGQTRTRLEAFVEMLGK